MANSGYTNKIISLFRRKNLPLDSPKGPQDPAGAARVVIPVKLTKAIGRMAA